ncbi:MAG: hypothetical protein FJX23_09730, partial [Alphaproteobacteria bacterium]|nr:hypothetical protein [Alphaproteobacteria bacterium]
MRMLSLFCLATLLAACAQQPQQPVRSRDYFVSNENPYAGQPGVPQRLNEQQFRQQVRQQNGAVVQQYDTENRYGETAMRSSL